MARSLNQFVTATDQRVEVETQSRLDRSTTRVLGAAVAALATATIVVSQSSEALNPTGTTTANTFESGTIALVDDDRGRSLVALENMAPGRPVEQCITVSYAGTILPVAVTMGADATGDVAEYVLVDIERGTAGGFGSCEGFVPTGLVYRGVLGELTDDDPLAIGELRSEGEAVSFRFTFDLLDDGAASGREGSVDFVWEAVPA